MGITGDHEIMNDRIPHVAFIGRSNVGKSTTINALLGKRRLVKTSQIPGRTQEINFFEVVVRDDETTTDNDATFYFVDLPGYGYAKISKSRREELRKRILWYLTHPETRNKALVCIVIDAKVGLTEFDLESLAIVKEQQISYIVAVNKIDNLNQKGISALSKDLQSYEIPTSQIVLYSAKTKKMIHRLREKIFQS
jgi:GTP-binding protein